MLPFLCSVLSLCVYIGLGSLRKDSGDDKTDEETEGAHSEDETYSQKGLRRSQSMRSVKVVKGRKEVCSAFCFDKIKVFKKPLQAKIFLQIIGCFKCDQKSRNTSI